jgi:hypothetical protein
MASALEGDKLSAAADRFKLFSLFLCDAALVKLMTSLVALSMNNREFHPPIPTYKHTYIPCSQLALACLVAQGDVEPWSLGMDGGGGGRDDGMYTFVGSDAGLSLPDQGAANPSSCRQAVTLS